jgi:hypothetical protein
VAGSIRSIEKFNGRIGNRNRDLPACSRVPQATTLRRVPCNEKHFLLLFGLWGYWHCGALKSNYGFCKIKAIFFRTKLLIADV